ncbi:hypothetical protein U471_33020 [Bacillus amyloliquefaciens CC178]|nr:hypothetical protein U471_33020 [Bacillus amyloliquefaciens CC178]
MSVNDAGLCCMRTLHNPVVHYQKRVAFCAFLYYNIKVSD